ATLHALVYRPPPSAGPPPWPLVVCAYGGPGVQMVTNAWDATVRLRAQHLRQQGLLVASVDNRGSARRGRAFEAAVAGNLGDLEVRDQVDGVRWLAAEGLADPTRAAIYGWSYGGYLSAMALGRAPETFRAAVAGAPVTHWEGYDTHYTERYMGLPAENPDGYQLSSVMHHADAIRGRLLIVHGLMDENVHFRHTARLIEALTAAGVDYELVLLPGERHLPRDHAARTFVERRVSAFLAEALR
ncbi:MAG: S9 family peptidase, partial [Acidimicrobiales bacterium]